MKGRPLPRSASPALLGKGRAQWFGQLTLKAYGMTVLNVSRGEAGFGEMVVEVDGKPVGRGRKASRNVVDQVFTSKLGVRTTLKAGEEHVGEVQGEDEPQVPVGMRMPDRAGKHRASEAGRYLPPGARRGPAAATP